MNRPPVRLAVALLAIVAAAVVLAVIAVGLVGLLLALVLTQPMSHGRLVAATLGAVGLGLLVLAHVLDRHALPHAVSWSRTVAASLVGTVASAGQR